MAQMVTQQEEMLMRIDQQLDDTIENVGGIFFVFLVIWSEFWGNFYEFLQNFVES